MQRKQFTLFGRKFSILYGRHITLQELEKSIQSAILRKSYNRDLPWNSSSWFKMTIESNYLNKQIRVVDFTGTLKDGVYSDTAKSIEELLFRAKAYFDEIK